MTIYSNSSEGGSNGTTITAGNSGGGSGNAWSFVGPSAGAEFTYASGHGLGAAAGSLATRFQPHASSSYYLRWDLTESVSNRGVMRMTFKVPATTTGDTALMAMRGNNAFMASLLINSSRVVWVRDGYNTALTSLNSPALTAGGVYTIEFSAKAATQDTTGPYDGVVAVRIEDSTGTVVHEQSVSTARTRTNFPNEYRFFGISASTGWTDVYADNFRAGQQASGWLGPSGVTPPTLVLAGDIVRLVNATGSTVPSGTITYAISQTSGPSVTPTLLAPGLWTVAPHASSTLVYNVTATGSLGGSDSETVTIPPLTVVEAEGYDETLVYNGSSWV